MSAFVKAAAVVALSGIASVATGAVHAADRPVSPDTVEGGTVQMESLVVLGLGRRDTTELTSTTPVDVISPEQLEETVAVTVNQALSKLHPSFTFPPGPNAVKG